MTVGRVAAGAVGAIALVGLFVVIGKSEARSSRSEAVAGIERVQAQVTHPSTREPLVGAFSHDGLDCFDFKGRPSGILALCFDAAARLVEATDYRAIRPRTWSITLDTAAAPFKSTPAQLNALLSEFEILARVTPAAADIRTSFGSCLSQLEVVVNKLGRPRAATIRAAGIPAATCSANASYLEVLRAQTPLLAQRPLAHAFSEYVDLTVAGARAAFQLKAHLAGREPGVARARYRRAVMRLAADGLSASRVLGAAVRGARARVRDIRL